MDRFLNLILPRFSRKETEGVLACVWIFGLISGVAASTFAGEFLVSQMRMASISDVSIYGLLSAILLPLLLSAFAVSVCNAWLLIPIVFAKAFFFSYFAFGVMNAFGTAGWLIRWLLIFSDSMSLPVLWLFWLRSLRRGRSEMLYRIIPAVSVGVLIGSLDFTVISPFLVQILSF